MNSIHTIEGLLFRSYLTGYNLKLLHTCIQNSIDDLDSEAFRKASLSQSNLEFERKTDDAKTRTEKALRLLNTRGIKTLAHFDKSYPQDLLKIQDYPPLLFIKGELPSQPCAAIVGSRQISPLAEEKTNRIVRIFLEHHYGIVSGLALGIDTLAHKAALNQRGYTAAVLPTSLDRIYPPENLELAQTILDWNGTLLSEQAPFLHSLAHPFVLRNRIQAALSDYVVPVEMGKDSGTRHTIQYAIRQNKKVVLYLPGTMELNYYVKHYEGIIAATKLKKKYGNQVVSIKNHEDLLAIVHAPQLPKQGSFFDDP